MANKARQDRQKTSDFSCRVQLSVESCAGTGKYSNSILLYWFLEMSPSRLLAVLCHGPRFQVIDLRPIFFQPITAKVVIGAKKAYRGHRAQGSCCDDSRDSAEARKRLLGRWLGERCPRNQQSGVPAARTCAMSRYAVPSAGGKSRARSAKMNA